MTAHFSEQWYHGTKLFDQLQKNPKNTSRTSNVCHDSSVVFQHVCHNWVSPMFSQLGLQPVDVLTNPHLSCFSFINNISLTEQSVFVQHLASTFQSENQANTGNETTVYIRLPHKPLTSHFTRWNPPLPPYFLSTLSAGAPSSYSVQILPGTTGSVSRWSCGWAPGSPCCHHCASRQQLEAEEKEEERLSLKRFSLQINYMQAMLNCNLTFPGVKDFSPLIEILSSGRILS